MAVVSADHLAEADIAARSQERGEPDWLRERRLTGWRAFERNPMPQLERTRLRESLLQGYDLPGAVARTSTWHDLAEEIRQSTGHASDPSNTLVMENGFVRFADLSAEWAEKGVVFGSLADIVVQRPELVKDYLMGEAVGADGDKPWALNAALWNDGIFLYVPEGVEIDVPLQILQWASGNVGVFDRTLVVAGPNSNVTVVETVTSDPEGPKLRTGVVEVYLQDGSHVKYCALQTLGQNVTNLILRRAIVGPNATMHWVVGEFGSSLTAGLSDAYLQGRGGEASNTTVFFADSDQHLDVEPKMLHLGTHTQSNILVKGVAKGTGRSVYAPITAMEDEADEAAAFQRGTTLLLSPEARAYSLPQLFVGEERVAGAGHAATIGRVDEEQVFYLRSRGLTEQAAINLLVTGFFHPVIDTVPVPGVRDRLFELIDRKLAG